MTAAQLITLETRNPARRVTALRGQTAPIPTGGYGGWQTVDRPHRKALTEWQGIGPMQLQLSLLLDGGASRASIEDDCLTLEQMAQPNGTSPPSPVTISGAVPHTELAWQITNLGWDPVPIYSQRGYRTRHEVTVTVIEHVNPDSLPTAAATARTKSSVGSTYIVKKGDTLVSIAARQLGDYTRWTAIANLNGLRDPNILKVGQRLRLP